MKEEIVTCDTCGKRIDVVEVSIECKVSWDSPRNAQVYHYTFWHEFCSLACTPLSFKAEQMLTGESNAERH